MIERTSFDLLFEALESRGYEVIGPTVRQGAVAFEPIRSSAEMPVGLTDVQDVAVPIACASGASSAT